MPNSSAMARMAMVFECPRHFIDLHASILNTSTLAIVRANRARESCARCEPAVLPAARASRPPREPAARCPLRALRIFRWKIMFLYFFFNLF
jgi:hypothetical protein